MDLRVGLKDILVIDIKEKLLLFFLLFSGITIPFSYAINSISIAILFLVSFIFFKRDLFIRRAKQINVLLYIIVFYLICLFGVLYSYNTSQALVNLERSIPILLFPIIFINVSDVLDIKMIVISIWGLVIGTILVLLSSQISIANEIINTNSSFSLILTHYVRVEFIEKALVIIHPPYFAFLTLFSFISIYLFPIIYKIKVPLLIYLFFSLYEISGLMSILILSLFIFFEIIIPFIKGGSLRALYSIILFLLLSFTTIIFYNHYSNTLSGSSIFDRIEWALKKGDTSRPDNWSSVINVIKNNPIIGVGTDGGINQLQQYRKENWESFINKHNAHNQFLEILLRYGFLGLSLFILILYKFIYMAIISRDKIFIWLIILFILVSITESVLERQIGIVFFSFYSTIYYIYYSTNKIKNEKSTNSRLVLR